MFRLIVVLTLSGCAIVNAQSCMDTANNATFLSSTTIIVANLPSISDPPTSAELTAAFTAFCTDSTITAAVASLENLIINECYAYAMIVDIGPVTLHELIDGFTTIEAFCNCTTEFLAAIAFDVHVEAGGQYTTVGDFPAMCADSSFQAALTVLADQQCTGTFNFGGITASNIAALVQTFVAACDGDEQANFDCVMGEQTQADFKTCITDASTACQREDCMNHADLYMNCTALAKDIFKVSVLFTNPDAFVLDCSSAANTATMSFLLLASAAIYSKFWAE